MPAGAEIMEIFSSIQGEGLLVGRRQIFVRFYGCNIRCVYCDTPASRSALGACIVERSPGMRDFYALDNPVDVAALNGVIHTLEGFEGLHHSISLTGGEPLLHASFLKEWLPAVRGRFGIYLETNGTLADELGEVIGLIDIVAMDVKLPGTADMEPRWDDHHRFLATAVKKDTFVKLVVDGGTREDEFERAVRLVSRVGRGIPLIIQPVTPAGDSRRPVSYRGLLRLHELAARSLDHVRVIPQTHKMLGML